MMIRTLILFCTLLTISACDSNPFAPSDIIGDRWRLVSMIVTGTPVRTVDDPSKYTVEFQEDDNLAVRSDCNSCGGSYTVSDSSIDIVPVCTKVACSESSLDDTFRSALERVQEFSLDDDELTLSADGVRLTLVRD